MRIILIVTCALIGLLAGPARAQAPITIGFGMALTGGLAPNGKAALLAMQIWMDEINAKGGLLGRPVKLDYYDDQSNPATIPGIYTKLLDVDKVDLVVSGYATNMIAPAMPVIMQHNRTFLSLFGLAVNSEFNYPNYFSFTPTGGPQP
jgi:branched-chain amino acid transport system substrate-binding protein